MAQELSFPGVGANSRYAITAKYLQHYYLLQGGGRQVLPASGAHHDRERVPSHVLLGGTYPQPLNEMAIAGHPWAVGPEVLST